VLLPIKIEVKNVAVTVSEEWQDLMTGQSKGWDGRSREVPALMESSFTQFEDSIAKWDPEG
jgi:hypothetical protein